VTETTLTVVRHYVEAGQPKAEAIAWSWVRSSLDDSRGVNVDPGLAARARPLPPEFDPGLEPNLWVWVQANDPAAKLPRAGETVRSTVATSSGETVDTVEHFHAEKAPYWDYYRLPLRDGVELITEDRFAALVEARTADTAKARAEIRASAQAAKDERAATVASARAKLAALGLTDAEIDALTR
jgi:hypothetical protein